MLHPFAVNIAAIRGKPGNRRDVQCRGVIDELQVSGSTVPEGADVEFEGFVEAIDGGIVAEGMVRAAWVGECRRCLGPAGGPIEQRSRELFESDPAEGETYPIAGDNIDLEPMIRETVVLELPEAPLCGPECAGLCPVCGINRNEQSCDCAVDFSDPRWAALDQLKSED